MSLETAIHLIQFVLVALVFLAGFLSGRISAMKAEIRYLKYEPARSKATY